MDYLWPVVIVVVFLSLLSYILLSPRKAGTRESGSLQFMSLRPGNATKFLASDYEKNCLLLVNEKVAYWRLQSITSELGCIVFPRVPLGYIIRPRRGVGPAIRQLDYTDVDFVICDNSLKVCLVIMLEPSGYDSFSSEIDTSFTDQALKYCGVDVLHTKRIDSNVREWITSRMCKLYTIPKGNT